MWPTHGHEVTRGYFRALTRPRTAVRIQLRPTYFAGRAPAPRETLTNFEKRYMFEVPSV